MELLAASSIDTNSILLSPSGGLVEFRATPAPKYREVEGGDCPRLLAAPSTTSDSSDTLRPLFSFWLLLIARTMRSSGWNMAAPPAIRLQPRPAIRLQPSWDRRVHRGRPVLVSNGTREALAWIFESSARSRCTTEAPALGGRQQRALLALLLLHANEAVLVERIIDELWPDAPPPSATKSVQALAARLRRTLGEPSAPNGDARSNGVVLDTSPRLRSHGCTRRARPDRLELLEAGRGALAAGRAGEASATCERRSLCARPTVEEFASDSSPAATSRG